MGVLEKACISVCKWRHDAKQRRASRGLWYWYLQMKVGLRFGPLPRAQSPQIQIGSRLQLDEKQKRKQKGRERIRERTVREFWTDTTLESCTQRMLQSDDRPERIFFSNPLTTLHRYEREEQYYVILFLRWLWLMISSRTQWNSTLISDAGKENNFIGPKISLLYWKITSIKLESFPGLISLPLNLKYHSSVIKPLVVTFIDVQVLHDRST